MSSAAKCLDNHTQQIPSFESGIKLDNLVKLKIWEILQSQPDLPSRILLNCLRENNLYAFVTIRHINRFRVEIGLSRSPGNPHYGKTEQHTSEVVHVSPNISFIGLHILNHWVDQESKLDQTIHQIESSIKEYTSDNSNTEFPLLKHKKDTIIKRFKALLYAPLMNIKFLSEYDRKLNALPTIVGSFYQSSTLNQFSGQLERINAGDPMVQALSSEQQGDFNYVDGHMIAYWSTKSMHKGKITMANRIMSGSQAVITHNEAGYGVFVEYYPPDIQMTQFILDYCQRVVKNTNSNLFVIDRAVNSVELAKSFDSKNLGLLSMLNDSDHKGMKSFKADHIFCELDGTDIYSAVWASEDRGDPRKFVISKPKDGSKILVFWSTSMFFKNVQFVDWPSTYRARNDIQENSFKNMIAHGALNTNYGRKLIEGPDRHQERKSEGLTKKLTNNQKKQQIKQIAIQNQEPKVKESKDKNHGKRLEQRQSKLLKLQDGQKKLSDKESNLESSLQALGAPKKRYDRDYRKQLIMTVRTLLLENIINDFFLLMLSLMGAQCDLTLGLLIELFFQRNGQIITSPDELIYRINMGGLNQKNNILLNQMLTAINQLNLRSENRVIKLQPMKARAP
jgi:hypothetical protein